VRTAVLILTKGNLREGIDSADDSASDAVEPHIRHSRQAVSSMISDAIVITIRF